MAAGRPVIAFAGGGALDYVKAGHTGVLFEEQSLGSLTEVLANFDDDVFDSGKIREEAMRFDRSQFESKLRGLIDKVWS
jgi:glycosyltransferase involved in cell wall biosynthesis